MQHTRHVLQPCQRQVGGLAQILFGEFSLCFAIGIPVDSTALFGFLAGGVGAALTMEGKGGYLIQPGKPGRVLDRQVPLLAQLTSGEFVDLVSSGPGQGRGGDVLHGHTLVRCVRPPLPNSGYLEIHRGNSQLRLLS